MFSLTVADVRFCLWWTLATTLAIALCSPLGPMGLFMGPVVVAIAQGAVLRWYWPQFWLWGVATLGGGLVAIALLVIWVLFAHAIPLPLMIFIGGTTVGMAQALVLRSGSRLWRWWPIVSGVILTVSLFWFMPDIINASIYGTQRIAWQWLALASLTGLIGGSLKGFALNRFLKLPPTPSQNQL